MINSFDSDIACDVGVNAAILYKNIQYWCEKNRTNEQNEHDGLYWTYNSISAFENQFPYMTNKQIRAALKILEDHGYIISGNYNKSSYDRTKWYADLWGRSNVVSGQIHLSERANGLVQKGEPIPNINTNINTNIIKKESKTTFDEILDSVEVIKNNSDLRETFIDFIKMRKVIKKPLTDRGLKGIINDTFKFGNGDSERMKMILEQSIKSDWQGVYELKEEKKQEPESGGFVNPFTELRKQEGLL